MTQVLIMGSSAGRASAMSADQLAPQLYDCGEGRGASAAQSNVSALSAGDPQVW